MRKNILFLLFYLLISLLVFTNDTNSYNIYIENRETGKSVEVFGNEKYIIKKYIDKLDMEKAKLLKAPIDYIIILEIDNEMVRYKFSGRYIARAENDLYIECNDEIMDIIKKIGI